MACALINPPLIAGHNVLDRTVRIKPTRTNNTRSDLPQNLVVVDTVSDIALLTRRLHMCAKRDDRSELLEAAATLHATFEMGWAKEVLVEVAVALEGSLAVSAGADVDIADGIVEVDELECSAAC